MNNELKRKVNEAIGILQANECTEGFSVRFSGGKDSCVLKHLITQAGYKAKYYYLETTLESDMMANFIKNKHPEVVWIHPEKSVCEMIKEYKMMPTGYNLFCCKQTRRGADRRLTEEHQCTVLGKKQTDIVVANKILEPVQVKENGHKVINPLYNWTDDDVWGYIDEYSIALPETYAIYGRSFNCTLCVMQYVETKQLMVQVHPEITAKLKSACFGAWEANELLHENFPTPDDYWNWFLNYDMKAEKQKMVQFNQPRNT